MIATAMDNAKTLLANSDMEMPIDELKTTAKLAKAKEKLYCLNMDFQKII